LAAVDGSPEVSIIIIPFSEDMAVILLPIRVSERINTLLLNLWTVMGIFPCVCAETYTVLIREMRLIIKNCFNFILPPKRNNIPVPMILGYSTEPTLISVIYIHDYPQPLGVYSFLKMISLFSFQFFNYPCFHPVYISLVIGDASITADK
jgi:hypothetical protein